MKITIHYNVICVFVFQCCLFSQVVLAQDYNNNQPAIEGPANLLVNSYTGNLNYQRTDIFIPSRGFDIDLTFTYNSARRDKDWGFGRGWTASFNMAYAIDTIGIRIERMDGRQDVFTEQDGQLVAGAEVFDVLEEYQTDQYRLTQRDGVIYYFDDPSHKRITSAADRYGNTLQFTYTDSLINTMTDAAGRVVEFQWQEDRLVGINTQTAPQRTVAFEYNENGDPIRATNAIGGFIEYRYDDVSLMTGLIDENGNTIEIVYNNLTAVKRISSCLSSQFISYDYANVKTHFIERVGRSSQVTSYQFDEHGRVIKQSGNCCGYEQTYEYDEAGNVIKLTDANGNNSFFSYDSRGNQLQAIDPLGNFEEYEYEPTFNNVTHYKDKNDNVTTYEYDANGNLTAINYPLGISRSMDYNEYGEQTSATDGNGHTTNYTYNVYGYITEQTDALGSTATYNYDQVGNLIDSTDWNGHQSSFSYDALDRLVELTDPLGHTETYDYDNRRNQTSFTDKNGHTTTYLYDAFDRMIELEDPLGYQERYIYDARNLVRFVDKNGHATEYEYDNLNRLVKVENAEGELNSYDYDAAGNLILLHHSSGNEISFTYNGNNRLINVTDVIGPVESMEYDNNSNVISRIDARGNETVYIFDELDRIVSATDPIGGVITYTYDNNSNPITQVDKNGNPRSHEYDALNRLTTITDALGYTSSYTYDNSGNTVSIIDQNSNIYHYEYDALNRQVKEIYPDGSQRTYTFSPTGQVIGLIDNNNQTITYDYDELDRLLTRSYPNNTSDEFAYDGVGNYISGQNEHALVELTYDKTNRVTSETLNNKTTAYSYDVEAGKRTIVYPSGRVIVEQTDARRRLTSIADESFLNDEIASFTYDDSNQLTSRSLYNGTYSNYQIDNNSRVTEILHNLNEPVQFNYSYDATGNQEESSYIHNQSNSRSYAYDEVDRLIGVDIGLNSSPDSEIDYQYDGAGNRLSVDIDGTTVNYTSNSLNQYTETNGVQNTFFTYDDNGNLTSDGINNFSYDFENRIVQVENQTSIEFQYDAFRRRIKKIVGVDTTSYYYENLNIIEKRNNNEVISGSFVYHFNAIDEVISMYKDGNHYFYHTDAISTIHYITNLTGEIVEHYDYDEFGSFRIFDAENLQIPSSSLDNPFFFTGREYDAEIGYYYYRARTFNANIGRFLQRDPLGFIDGLNTYSYVNNNPVINTDPLGLFSFVWYGNWGGPGWANRNFQSETGPNELPRGPNDPGWKKPRDKRDNCYFKHDTCLRDCAKTFCEDNIRQNCRKGCDLNLANCLESLPWYYRLLPNFNLLNTIGPEIFVFRHVIPNNNPGKFIGQ